jgi:NAD+ diphosphatase
LTLAYIHSPLDRTAEIRTNPDQLASLRRATSTQTIFVAGDHVQATDGKIHVQQGATGADSIFLGIDDDKAAWFADAAVEGLELVGLRDLMLDGETNSAILSILAQARSMVGWHLSHAYCAKCGNPSQMADAGYRRHCDACGADHFPRTDPVVIMAVTHGSAILLGRQASWKPGMYSALAGFMEPGETIEQAVAREILEEAGVIVHDVRYVTCQPWPFPSSLMIGMVAQAKSRDLLVDHSEIEDARWFEKHDIRMMLDRTHPENLYAAHPYAIAHHIIVAALKEIETQE